MNIINNISNFFLCLLYSKCKYSIKKFFSFIFMILIIYLCIFTNKIEIINSFLLMLAGLLAIRSFDKDSFRSHNKNNNEPEI